MLGAQLLQAAAGRPLLADERMQLAVNLLLKEEQHDTAAAAAAAGPLGRGGRAAAHGRLRAAAADGGGAAAGCSEVELSAQGGWFDALPPAESTPPEQETLAEDRCAAAASTWSSVHACLLACHLELLGEAKQWVTGWACAFAELSAGKACICALGGEW